MLEKLYSIFKKSNAKSSLDSPELSDETRHAAAALLMIIAQCDGEIDENEREISYRFIEQKLGTTIKSVEDFITELNREDDIINLFHLTRILKQNLDYKSLEQIVSMIQIISYADGGISGIEEQKVGQIAEMLGVEIAPPLSN